MLEQLKEPGCEQPWYWTVFLEYTGFSTKIVNPSERLTQHDGEQQKKMPSAYVEEACFRQDIHLDLFMG